MTDVVFLVRFNIYCILPPPNCSCCKFSVVYIQCSLITMQTKQQHFIFQISTDRLNEYIDVIQKTHLEFSNIYLNMTSQMYWYYDTKKTNTMKEHFGKEKKHVRKECAGWIIGNINKTEYLFNGIMRYLHLLRNDVLYWRSINTSIDVKIFFLK